MSIKKHVYPLVAVFSLAILLMAVFAWASTPSIPDFNQYPEGKERKVEFFRYFRPLIEQQNHSIRSMRRQLKTWYENRDNLSWFAQSRVENMAEEYGLIRFDMNNDKHWKTLLRRVDVVPTSLALAQAAMESAWGTSRFAREVHNYFGQWCFSKDCGMVPSNRDPGARHEVKGFDSPDEAVASYVHNLNTHHAYQSFRDIRAKLRAEDKPLTGVMLSNGLTRYSERGADYIRELRAFIKNNKLSQYD